MYFKGTLHAKIAIPDLQSLPSKNKSDQSCGRYRRFSNSKSVYSVSFSTAFYKQDMRKSLSHRNLKPQMKIYI